MNNTLTGLGLALVLALLAALIGPWFVNWTAYRDDFARQASALVGAPVAVSGAVDARLLPTPYVRFRGLSSGQGATRFAIDEVEIELAIAPLLRGEFKAERVRLVRPKLGIEATEDGTVRTAFSTGRKTAPGRVSFDRAEIVDGEVTLKAPWGVSALSRIAGLADAGSLAGPYRFEGTAGPDGRRLDLRVSTSRADASGALKLKLSANEAGRRTTFEADGALMVAAKPGFEGRFALARPPKRGEHGEPWSAGGALRIEGGRLRADGLELVYGPDDRAARLGGSALVAFAGGAPRVELRLDTRQIDLDRLLGEGRPRTPAAVLAEIASRLPSGFAPPADGSFALDARGLVLAGDVVRDLKLELDAEKGSWRLRRASATLPGEAKASASGSLAVSGGTPGFVGPAEFDAADLPTLRRWLAGGRGEGPSLVRRFALKGEVSARPDAVTVEKAEIATDGARSTGRLAWSAGGEDARSRLQAALVSDRLDLDALGLDRVLGHALSAQDGDVFLALDAKSLQVWGVTMRDVSIDGSLDAAGLDLKRLEIRDANGARISGAGRLASGADGPRGKLGFKVAGETLAPLIAVARAGGAPPAALDAIEARAGAIAPVDLQIDLEAADGARRLAVAGQAAGGRLDARLSAPDLSLDVPAELDLKLASEDGRRLAALAGVALSPVQDARGGEIALRLSGAPARGMTGEGRFDALGLAVTGRGALAFAPVAGLSAEGEATVAAEDLGRVAAALGRGTPLTGAAVPARLVGKVSVGPEGLRVEDLKGEVAGRAVSGRASAPSDPSKPIEGRLAVDELPAAALMALAFSPEAVAAPGDGSVWPTAGFGASPLRGLVGRFEMTAARLPLFAGQVATEAAFTLALKRDGIAVEGLAAKLDQGRLSGAASVSRSGPDAAASLDVTLSGAAADRALGLDPKTSPVTGAVDLKLEAQGTGRSLAGLVGSLTGAGQISLSDAMVRRLDPQAIGRIEPQVEAGLALDAPKVSAALARELDKADLRLGRAAASFTISGGVARTGGIDAGSDAVRLGGVAAVDLRRLVLDADLTLQPVGPDAPQVAVAFDGPMAAPVRKVDATSFTGWLSVRAVERETKRIEAMEADARERARIARERQEEERKRQDEERKRAEAEKARLEAERRKADVERRKREAETGALIDALPRPATPALPHALDLTPDQPEARQRTPVAPPAGVFAPQGLGQQGVTPQARPVERSRVTPEALPPAPQSILPPVATPR